MESFSNTFRPKDDRLEKPVLEENLDGETIDTPHGPCFVITRFFKAGSTHGSEQINRISHISPDSLVLLGKGENFADMDLTRTLFFDTETTGLSSGAGTHIFLSGFGYYENEGFVVKQFFLRELDEEPAFLHAINELMKNYISIVSYNGKSFDWPVLGTRFIYSRVKNKLAHPLHLDLVYTARRIWKRRLGDCSLQNIEREILNFHRVDDVPGFEIPGRYFRYLRDKRVQPLIPVLTHNRLDILSLAALLIKSAFIVTDPFLHLEEHLDLYSLAYTFESMQQWERSIAIYKEMLKKLSDRKLKQDIALRLSYCYKRTRQWRPAVELWENIISQGYIDIEPYVELAKYEEHYRRDYQNAEKIVSKALNLIDMADELRGDSGLICHRDALDHRLKRIKRKMGG